MDGSSDTVTATATNVNNSASKENKEPGVLATSAAPASPAAAASAEANDEGEDKKDETLSVRVEKGEGEKEEEEETIKKPTTVQVIESIHQSLGTEEAMREMKILTERFKPGAEEAAYVESILMNEVWKDGETKINKLEKSLVARCPSQWTRNDKETYVAEIIGCLKSSWELEPNNA